MTEDQKREQAEVDAAAGAANGEPQAEGPQEPAQAASSEPPAPKASEESGDAEALRERYLRLAAEYDNYRKRTERERAESWVRAQAQLVEKLLEPLDDLQRVAHFNSETATAEALLEGVQMVERKLLRVLESAGLETVEAKGQAFDPSLHEALMTTAAESHEEDDSVGEVFQQGYQFKGVLLRPARVQVRKYGG